MSQCFKNHFDPFWQDWQSIFHECSYHIGLSWSRHGEETWLKSTEYLSIHNLPCNHPTRNAWGPNPMYSRRRIAAMPVTSRGFRSRHRQVTRTEWSTSKSQVMASTHSNTQRVTKSYIYMYTTTKIYKKKYEKISKYPSLMNSCEIVINNSYLRQAQLRGQSMRRPAV